MGEAHYALAWAYYDAGDYDTGFRHVEMAYRSGISLGDLKDLLQLFKSRRGVKVRTVSKPSKIGAYRSLVIYTAVAVFTFIFIVGTSPIIAFPRGCDAYAHIYKAKYILKYFPNFWWNYQWDFGVPIFGGTYPPLSYFMIALTSKLFNIPVEYSINILSTASIILLMVSISALIYDVTKDEILTMMGPMLIIFTPAFWVFWFVVGTYARVLSLGFAGLSLYLFNLIYNKKRINRLALYLFPISLTLSILTHIIGGLTALALIFGVLIFKGKSLLHSLLNIFKLILIIFPLNMLYIMQFLFSNPNRASKMLIGGVNYDPAKLSYLIYTPSHLDLFCIIFPMFIILTILNIKYLGKTSDKNLKAWNISSLIYFIILLIYSYMGYIKFYPRNLYISGFGPEHPNSISILGVSLYVVFSLNILFKNVKINKDLKRAIKIFILLLCITIGFILETPIIGFNIMKIRLRGGLNFKPYLAEGLNIGNDVQYRIGIKNASIAIWFNYYFDVPQSRDYYDQGVPYAYWKSWFEKTVWVRPKTYEAYFLLDWYAIRWIVSEGNECGLFDGGPYNLTLKRGVWCVFEYLNYSRIAYSTKTTPILFIGSREKYDVFLRALSITGLGSDYVIPLLGRELVDSYTLKELREFPLLILYGYKYKSLKRMAELLSAYVYEGGCLFLEANGSPDFAAEALPDPFPVRETHTSSIMEDWLFEVSPHPISDGVNFTLFSPPRYGEFGWGVSSTIETAEWAAPIICAQGKPIIVAGEYGRGRVVWSGMNLFYHTKSFRNSEEAKFIVRILRWLKGIEKNDELDYDYQFINPQRRIIKLNEIADGILFKECYFKQWHAILVEGSHKTNLKIYMAGPGMMYIPLPEFDPPADVILIYDLSLPEKAGYLISLISLIALAIIAWRRPSLLYSMYVSPIEEEYYSRHKVPP